MAKSVFMLIALSTCLFFSSCQQCTNCVKYPKTNDKVKLCKKDFASDDSYNAYYRQLVYDGYRCE